MQPNTACDPYISKTRWKAVGAWYQAHYEPDFVCSGERRIGKLGDGGKWVGDPRRITKQDTCLLYSVGSNGDFSFEEAVKAAIGPHCEIHTFDFGNYGHVSNASVLVS